MWQSECPYISNNRQLKSLPLHTNISTYNPEENFFPCEKHQQLIMKQFFDLSLHDAKEFVLRHFHGLLLYSHRNL
jgi:hypothetical protein